MASARRLRTAPHSRAKTSCGCLNVPLKAKIDENIPLRVGQPLAQHGHDVSTVRDEGLSGAPDRAVFDAIVRERRMLVTLDRGFGDIRAYPPGSNEGIIILRCADQSAGSVARVCEELLRARDLSELQGC